jgi:L-ascorbate metabolism protein UlaG (beta-lactamase superfamily)
MDVIKKPLYGMLNLFILMAISMTASCGQEPNSPGKELSMPKEDVVQTTDGDLKLTFIGHGTLMLTFNGKVYHVDPWSKLADYSKLPKADVILITHDHYDHLDAKAIELIYQKETQILMSQSCEGKLAQGVVMKNGETKKLNDVTIEAVPAYNIQNKRPDGSPYHPKGNGNGYILTFGKTRVYIAGDTENTPEMNALKAIDVAFLPMNMPYTMTPKMVADAAKAFKPKILYPYHYGQTNVQQLVGLLKDTPEIEVRIRKME